MTVFKYFDKNGNELKAIDFIEIQWNRKFDETGNFSIYTTAKEWNNNIKYIQNVGRPETGIVQKISYDKQTSGDYLEISGMFLETLLSFGANYLAMSITGATTQTQVKTLLSQYVKGTMATSENAIPANQQIYKVLLSTLSNVPSSMNVNIPMGTSVEEMLYDYLIPLGYSYYCKPIFNPQTNESQPLIGAEIVVYKSVDKTNNIYFGNVFKNVSDVNYTLDESNQYPRYLAVQEIPVEQRFNFTYSETINTESGPKSYIFENLIVSSNKPSGLGNCVPMKILATQVQDVEMVASNETLIRSQMRQLSTLDMLNNYRIETISVDVIQNRFLYLTDYTLGDKCSIQIDEIEQQFTARIVEVNEVHRNNASEIQLVLGTPNKVKYIKQYRR